MRLSPYPVEPDAISGEDSIRTELNCRIPSWCCREWLGVEKDLHMSGGEQCQMQRALYKDKGDLLERKTQQGRTGCFPIWEGGKLRVFFVTALYLEKNLRNW